MPVVESGVYRLSEGEVVDVWGLAERVSGDVEAGFAVSAAGGVFGSVGEAADAFYGEGGGHAAAWKMLLGFCEARPLSEGDGSRLGMVLHVEGGGLVCDGSPVGLYGLSHRLEAARRESGRHRRWLAGLCSDGDGVLALLGMASVQRPKAASLQRMAFAARLVDARGVARGWAAGFPLAVS